MELTESNDIFNMVLDKAHNFLIQRDINIVSKKTLMKALPIVIECVETVSDGNITGEQKKDLALKVLLFIVNESKIEEHDKNTLVELIEGGTLETTIEIIIDASKGKLQLNRRRRRQIFSCLAQCFETLSAVRIPLTHVTEVTVTEETVPEVTVAEETVAEETVPEVTVTEETVTEETVTEETVAEETVAEDNVAKDTVAEEDVDEPLPELPKEVRTTSTEV